MTLRSWFIPDDPIVAQELESIRVAIMPLGSLIGLGLGLLNRHNPLSKTPKCPSWLMPV
jgi:thiazole synthase ThiGH ThiG subunit